jgi:hypothetical protein
MPQRATMPGRSLLALRISGAILLAAFVLGAPFARGQALPPQAPTQTTSADQTSLPDAPNPSNASASYVPITPHQRVHWLLAETIGPPGLAAGVFTSAIRTGLDVPKEYGPGWSGFGKRNGIRLTGTATGNVIEAGVGAIWGEDPRYFRVPEKSFGARVKNVIKQTFLARRRDGNSAPAYARFIAIPGNNFLSNTWRADSEADNPHAVLRTLEGFGGRMAGNAFQEFWPDMKRLLFHEN